MNVLVTGASGFVGSYVVRELAARGHTVTGLVRRLGSVPELEQLGMRVAIGDITSPESLDAPMRGQDTVIHLAAVVGKNPGGWDNHEATGVHGTRHVVEAAVRTGVARLVHLSSCVVYKPPPPWTAVTEDSPLEDRIEPWNHYLRQKLVSEEVVWGAREKLAVTVVRPPTVLGPGDPNLIPYLRAVARSPLGAVARDRDCHFPVVVAEDLAAGIATAATRPEAAGRAYNMASDRVLTKTELLEAFRRAGAADDATAQNRKLALDLVESGFGWVDEVTRKLAPVKRLRDSATRRMEEHAHRRAQPSLIVECARARHDLGFSGARDVELAIQRTTDWFLGGAAAKHA